METKKEKAPKTKSKPSDNKVNINYSKKNTTTVEMTSK